MSALECGFDESCGGRVRFKFDGGDLFTTGTELLPGVEGLRCAGGDALSLFIFLGGGNWLNLGLLPDRLWVCAGCLGSLFGEDRGSFLGGGSGLNSKSKGETGPSSVKAGPGPLDRWGVDVEKLYRSSGLRNFGG